MSKIDGTKINKWVELAKNKKPEFVVVDQEQWAEALEGYQETFSNAVDENTTTEDYWAMIYFSAIAFCRGMERAEVKAGVRQESYYPRY